MAQAFECDSTFFQIFEAELSIGNKQTVLENPASMVVSESFAKRVFGEENPMGKIMTLPTGQFYGEAQDFTINGVMKDFPSNSHFIPILLSHLYKTSLNLDGRGSTLFFQKIPSPGMW